MKVGYRIWPRLSRLPSPVAPLAVAQTTGTIEGTVTDQNGGALPGVTVEFVESQSSGQPHRDHGQRRRYRFVESPAGHVQGHGEPLGFRHGRRRRRTSRSTRPRPSTCRCTLAAKEAVVVTGEAPIVDTTSTTTGSNYTAKVIDKLPVGRNYASIVLSQPGVQTDYGETQGRVARALRLRRDLGREPLHRRRRQHDERHQGLPGQVPEPRVHPGSRSQDGRLPGRVRPQHRRRDQRHHEVGRQRVPRRRVRLLQQRGHARRPDFETHDPDSPRRATSGYRGTIIDDRTRRKDYGVDLGGYFIKDQIWFFGAYDRLDETTTYFPLDGARANELFPLDYTADTYSGKLTFNIFAGHLDRRHALRGPADERGRAHVPPRPESRTPTRAARRSAARTGPPLQPALRLHRNPHRPVRPARGRVTDEPERPRRHPVRDRTVNPLVASGGFGQVFGPTVNNKSSRDQARRQLHALHRAQRDQARRRLPEGQHDGRHVLHGRPARRHLPCSRPARTSATRPRAVDHERGGRQPQVYYAHALFTPSGTDLTPLHGAVRRQHEALRRVPPGSAADPRR